MSTQPLGSPRFQAFGANNVPLSGGKLYSYAAGTTTPLDTYTTRAGDIANANPVILDANGFADVWMQAGVLYKFVLQDSAGAAIWTVDNFPSPADSTASTDAATVEPGGRLTLDSANPVTTADQTGKTTIYYVPYRHDAVPLFDGTSWALYSIGTGISQTTTDNTKSPAAVANNSNYDWFIWKDTDGTVRLSHGPPWASGTSRGTGVGTSEITQQNGRLVNANSISNGPAALCGLYVGSTRSDGSAQLQDSISHRYSPNAYNRVRRPMRGLVSSANYTYTSNVWREAAGSTNSQINFLLPLAEDAIAANALHEGMNNDAGGNSLYAAIGLDSTTAPDANGTHGEQWSEGDKNRTLTAFWEGFPGLGSHFLALLEKTFDNTGVATWNQTGDQAGINGFIMG